MKQLCTAASGDPRLGIPSGFGVDHWLAVRLRYGANTTKEK